MVKLWITKTVKKEGVTQSFLDWKFERCNYEELVDFVNATSLQYVRTYIYGQLELLPVQANKKEY